MRAYTQGSAAAAAQFGVEKTAVDWARWGNAAKQIMVGNPSQTWQRLRGGDYKGLLRDAFVPQTTFGKAMNWGLPMLGLYGAAQAPAEHRGSSVGEVAGGTLGAMLGSPLGVLGMSGGSSLLGALGKNIGSAFDQKPPHQRPNLMFPNGRLPVQHMLPSLDTSFVQ